ncbi:hypothetical protein [Pseudonocardia sp. ICBG1293]|uniref:hypothetical protein n=1 Tax=Pseudonocardia sp. ICBG1293 TaxID=2844382 RepID=UPI001CCD91A6|nr:hypothetical protein [Pseudonocardia sp. ICBG1293]
MSTTTSTQRAITVILAAAIPMSMTTGFTATAPVQYAPSPASISAPVASLRAALPSNHSYEEIARALERIASELERALASLPADQRDNPHAVRNALLRSTSHDRLNPVGVAACLAALGEFIITTGIPGAKIVKIIRDARKLHGSLMAALKAVRTNPSLSELGEESIAILQKIIGIDGVIAKCGSI